MNPKEKSRTLTQFYFDLTDHMTWEEAKYCSVKCVDEIILNCETGVSKKDNHGNSIPAIMYWREVKSEIYLL